MLSPQTQNPAGGRGSELKHATGQAQLNGTPPSVDLVLSRLDKVRKAGAGYTARCPAHEDRTASLSVTAGNDGRLLLHCFAGCSIGDITGAIGLTINDLFPRRHYDASPEARREARRLALQANWSASLGVLDRESTVVLIAAGDILGGRVLPANDADRLALAVERIEAARRVLRDRP